MVGGLHEHLHRESPWHGVADAAVGTVGVVGVVVAAHHAFCVFLWRNR